MKTLTKNYFIFVTICILLFVYFYFNQYFYTINLYDTYYLISYFFLVIPALIIGTIFYLIKILIPISYLKTKRITRNYLVFATICILLLIYFYIFDNFYILRFKGNFYFVSYYYFILPILIIGTIFYLVIKHRQIKNE
ncbi:hypothetical protein ASC72_19810 [Flavobacterium sp. Root420]|nr:hypothetical protein ASC72_19810 [Flavobacterium sp. Root420]